MVSFFHPSRWALSTVAAVLPLHHECGSDSLHLTSPSLVLLRYRVLDVLPLINSILLSFPIPLRLECDVVFLPFVSQLSTAAQFICVNL